MRAYCLRKIGGGWVVDARAIYGRPVWKRRTDGGHACVCMERGVEGSVAARSFPILFMADAIFRADFDRRAGRDAHVETTISEGAPATR